jgi:hypothetical protein
MTKLTILSLATAFLATNVLGLDCGTFGSILATDGIAAALVVGSTLLDRKE